MLDAPGLHARARASFHRAKEPEGSGNFQMDIHLKFKQYQLDQFDTAFCHFRNLCQPIFPPTNSRRFDHFILKSVGLSVKSLVGERDWDHESRLQARLGCNLSQLLIISRQMAEVGSLRFEFHHAVSNHVNSLTKPLSLR